MQKLSGMQNVVYMSDGSGVVFDLPSQSSCQSSTVGPFSFQMFGPTRRHSTCSLMLLDLWDTERSSERDGCMENGRKNGKKQKITLLELYPIVLAVPTWSASLANQCICFHTDNYALISIINQQTSRLKTSTSCFRNTIFQARAMSQPITFHACRLQSSGN